MFNAWPLIIYGAHTFASTIFSFASQNNGQSLVRMWVYPRALPEDLSCINTRPQGKCLYDIRPSAGGVMRDWGHKVLEIFIHTCGSQIIEQWYVTVIDHVKREIVTSITNIDFQFQFQFLLQFQFQSVFMIILFVYFVSWQDTKWKYMWNENQVSNTHNQPLIDFLMIKFITLTWWRSLNCLKNISIQAIIV